MSRHITPGWERDIDLRRLGGLDNDVIEQLYGTHEEAMKDLGFPPIEEALDSSITGKPLVGYRSNHPAEFGFSHFRDDFGGDWRAAYRELRRLWREEVKRRLGKL